jgi:glycosyltransferase involved in cell wall biosynthesis
VGVRKAHAGAVLVIPGNPTPRQRELRELAASLGDSGAVRFPGWVDGADLEGLYRAATAFAFPSLREGFGLPVLEAMRRGLPVACSNTSAVPEVAGDAALYFDPRRPEEIRAALERLLADGGLRAELAERGRRRAESFTWRRTARETLATYDRAREDR